MKLDLNFFLGKDKFLYKDYISVISATLKHEGKIILWYCEDPKSDYFDLLRKFKKIEFKKIPQKEQKNIQAFAWKIVRKGGIFGSLESVTLADWQQILGGNREILIPNNNALHGLIVRPKSKLAKKIKGFDEIFSYSSSKKIQLAEYGLLGAINPDYNKKGLYLLQDVKVGEFPNVDIKTTPLYSDIDSSVRTYDEEFVSKSGTVLGELIKKIMFEKMWNPFNKDVWGMTSESGLPLRKRKKKFRFHLLGLVHLPTSEKYNSCAFTQKNVKLAKMLLDLGHEVYLYGAERSDAPCTKFIQTHTLKDIRDAWGEGDNRFDIGYNWHEKQFKHDITGKKTKATLKYYATAISKINKIKKKDDFLLVTQGYYQKPIADNVNLYLTVEPGIGYRGSFTNFRAFESSYIQYFTYGSEHPRESIDGNYYDRVIPNYFDTKDFPYKEKKKDYFLFMGRLVIRKGLTTALKAARIARVRLIVAGQKHPETENLMNDPVMEYVGFADAKKRAQLLSEAKAVFTPSIYLEPFCGVHAEAMLCGTPVITTNFGAFTDYVIDGVNGYKCNTLQDFVDAVSAVDKLNPKVIKKSAEKFTMDKVKLEYQRWFQDLYRLWESADNKAKKGWHWVK